MHFSKSGLLMDNTSTIYPCVKMNWGLIYPVCVFPVESRYCIKSALYENKKMLDVRWEKQNKLLLSSPCYLRIDMGLLAKDFQRMDPTAAFIGRACGCGSWVQGFPAQCGGFPVLEILSRAAKTAVTKSPETVVKVRCHRENLCLKSVFVK